MDPIIPEVMKEVPKEIVVQAYKDALQPLLIEVGQLVAVPFKYLNIHVQHRLERTKIRLAEGIKSIPEERRVPPAPRVAVPVFEALALSDEGDVSDMFESLLLTSMDSDTADHVHPAFVEIIKQLSYEEVYVIKQVLLNVNDYEIWRFDHQESSQFLEIIPILKEVSNPQTAINNLERHYICKVEYRRCALRDFHYGKRAVEELRALQRQADIDEKTGKRTGFKGKIRITNFGQLFIDTCIRPTKG